MTGRRVAGRGRGRTILPAAALTFAAIAFAVACGSVTPSSPAASGPAATSASPDSSGTASGSARPRGTAWPGNAVLGIEALGAADGQITAAIADFGRGIATEDLALIRRAADGLTGLDVLLPNMDKITIFEPMRPFATQYETAIRAISGAARSLRSAIDAGDAAAITSTTQDLVDALRLYTDVQPELARWVQESIQQRRLLLN